MIFISHIGKIILREVCASLTLYMTGKKELIKTNCRFMVFLLLSIHAPHVQNYGNLQG